MQLSVLEILKLINLLLPPVVAALEAGREHIAVEDLGSHHRQACADLRAYLATLPDPEPEDEEPQP